MIRVAPLQTVGWHRAWRPAAASVGRRPAPSFSVRTQPTSVSLPSAADVVVIGGGAAGCSTLYHLAKFGITNTILLEAHTLTAGTTWHTAGLLWELRNSDIDTELIRTTRNLVMRLESETGVNPGWINNGGLTTAESKDRLAEYKRLMTLGRALGIETHLLDPEETKNLYPLMNVSDLAGSLFSPRDGSIDPAGYCQALTRSGKQSGAKVVEDCPVTDIKTRETLLGGKRVTEVHTPYGVIKTNVVVNATGGWSNHIASMVGVELPLMVLEHSYVITERIPGIENMPNVRETGCSAYLKLQGDALAVGVFEANPTIVDKLDNQSPFKLYDLNWDTFVPVLQGCGKRVPALLSTGIKSAISGPETFTPDHKPIMGEDPNVEGFYHCCAFNSSGMMLSGGCGHQMAHWIIQGRPELDMFSYDIRRLYAPLHRNKSWVIEKSHESYSKRHSIHYVHDEPLAGRGQRLSPLHKVLEEHGSVFQERQGWERPGWFNHCPTPVQPYDWYGAYGTPLNSDQRYYNALKLDYGFDFPKHHDLLRKECLSCRNAAVIFDLSHFGKFYLIGSDAQLAADWIFSANVDRKPGTAVYTCMLNQRGGVEADLIVSVCSDDDSFVSDPFFKGKGFYLTAGGPAAIQNLSHIMKEIRAHNWNVQVLNRTNDMALLSVQGPNSRDILKKVSDAELSNDAFPFSTHKVIKVADHAVRALRLSFVGEIGWELHMPNSSAIPVYKALMNAGEAYGLANAGYRALESLSCEKGYHHWHADVRLDDTPLEAGLGFACKLKTDTRFLGRNAIEAQKSVGITKKLVTFTLNNPSRPLFGLEGIWRNGKPVGFIRRAEYAFLIQRPIGHGYVQKADGTHITKDFLKTGTWTIESMGEMLDATVHTQSPFDPKGLRLRGYKDTEQQ